MRDSESPDSLADSFVRAYYTISVYRNRLIHKFYDEAAAITRGPRSLVFNADRGQDLIIPLPDNSVLTVLSHTVVPAGPSLLVSVAGLIEARDTKSGFSQHFVLSERNRKVWIVADVLTIFSDEFLAAPRDADSYLVPPPKRKQPPPRPPRAERDPRPRRESKSDAKSDPKSEPKAEPKPDQRQRPRRAEDHAGDARAEQDAKEGGERGRQRGGRGGRGRDARRGKGKKAEEDRFEWTPGRDGPKDPAKDPPP